jgi:hypothetical protein
MHQSNSVTALLAILLIVLNGKAIVEYVIWLRFKIRTTFKQMENDRNNQTNNRSRTIRG